MANRKYIALDIPAEGQSISDNEILTLLQDALLAAATSRTTEGRQEAARALAAAAADCNVQNYDDRYGSPTFYIP